MPRVAAATSPDRVGPDRSGAPVLPTTEAGIRRARRWMLGGLVISALGTRVVDGGVSGMVALGVLPIAWIALYATLEKILTISTPLLAHLLQPFAPARVLVLSDLIEGFTSLTALFLLVAWPQLMTPVLVAYLLLVAVLPVLGDLAEEFYAQQLAQIDSRQALAFNANVFSMLTLTGLVIAMPLGALVSGLSPLWVLAVNAVLSFGGFALRWRSMGLIATRPIREQHAEVCDGRPETPAPVRTLVLELFGTGAVSPGVSFLLQFSAGLSGTYIMLWGAGHLPADVSVSMTIMLMAFGAGATIGPQLAKISSRRVPVPTLLFGSTAASIAITICLLFISILVANTAGLTVGLSCTMFLFLSAALGRYRAILIGTWRQAAFRGDQFTRIMSWSLSLHAAGLLVGLWVALLLDAAHAPRWALAVAAGSLTALLPVFRREMTRPTPSTRS